METFTVVFFASFLVVLFTSAALLLLMLSFTSLEIAAASVVVSREDSIGVGVVISSFSFQEIIAIIDAIPKNKIFFSHFCFVFSQLIDN
ncbi:MAG: hypothetical protein KA463_05485 [Flavobacterium sp.]|uniref:hypothetical protein n=1 Tax=Flavobacterium sp. TaxID=239 RepID=UPI001B5D9C03|nr:hypothetical protein [Flavobacterium sp.]MBP6146620.1 hypothetical protein [Flavobacterium sp.]MBP7182242.1 hypothetical protein [Flavobacterium sp.]MBP7317663.1 hypothetical protein [Flavobacterium sp.]MBP8886187.1 hypothetical protein [Flavobacterium sp.]HRL70734.1 hypothetical protein [Flavobacterium sp.]